MSASDKLRPSLRLVVASLASVPCAGLGVIMLAQQPSPPLSPLALGTCYSNHLTVAGHYENVRVCPPVAAPGA